MTYVFAGRVRPLYIDDDTKRQLSLGDDGTLYAGAGAASDRYPLQGSDGNIQPARVRGGVYDLTLVPPAEANTIVHSDAFVTAVAERTLAGDTVPDQISDKRQKEREAAAAQRGREEALRAETGAAKQAKEKEIAARRKKFHQAMP